MLSKEQIDNHRYIVVKSFETRNGLIPEGAEIVMFRDIIFFNGLPVAPQYQAELRSVIKQTEEDLKNGKRSVYLRSEPFQPTNAVYNGK